MTTDIFIERLNNSLTSEGQELMTKFFVIFSRFECALKASNFANGDENKVSANWKGFISSIRHSFNVNRTPELRSAVDYLIQYPPKIQNYIDGHLGWRDRVFHENNTDIEKLSLSIRDIRNNLFHGGKFDGNYQEDVSRNYILLESSILIINEWLSLNATVESNFLEPII
jgi:hypothetical protein